MALQDGEKINLEKASIMLIDANNQGLDILTQVFAGFGARNPHRCSSAREAAELLKKVEVDLIVIEADLPGEMDGYDFVHWLRRSGMPQNAFAAVILVSGHTRAENVARGRDCGANFIIVKPISPTVLLQRVIWVAKENRQFVEAESYVGPDRRFKNAGPPPGIKPRRRDDIRTRLGAATMPNMDQDEIDNLMQPTRVNL
jgi:DNA-binding response OmpR family regulator